MRLLPTSLPTRLTLVVLVFCTGMAVLFTALIHHAHRAYSDELRQQQALAFARNVVQMYPNLSKLSTIDAGDVEDRFQQLLLLDPSSAMYLIDLQGNIVAGYTKQRTTQGRHSVAVAPIQTLLRDVQQGQPGKAVWGEDPDFPGMVCLFAAAPLNYGSQHTGYLYVLMRPAVDDPDNMLAIGYANRTALQVALGSAVLGGLLICVVMALLTRPLRQLTSAADAIREADVDGKLDATTLPHQDRKDEIGRLSRAFGAMVQRLREQVQRVRRMDATRRDWVASISHDLRTPLTSLMGHLETVLLRGERSTPAERQRFLEIALKNARHLDRLSASLFDFARLDSDEVRLEKSPAQVCELIDDIAARFAHGAEAKGIALATDCDHSLPLIPIDAALLERALANLVENALRYTPAGGTITLSAQREGEQIVLAVADTGPGVPEADLPRVFERFFQGSSQREGRGHAGLGLAIVRRVAELHGGRADAANLASGGARFSVYLPAP